MIRQAILPRPLGLLANVLLLILVLGSILLLGNDMQQTDQLQQTIDNVTDQQDQLRALQQQRQDTGWTRFASQHPDLLPQLDRLAAMLGPKDYLLMIQIDASGMLKLQVATENIDQAFALADRLRAKGFGVVLEQAQSASQPGGSGMVVNLGIENKNRDE